MQDQPALYLAFASLHVLLGHLGSALVHRLRFGRNPLVLYSTDPTSDPSVAAHRRVTRVIGGLSGLWALALVASALSPAFTDTWLGAPRLPLPVAVGWVVAALGLVGMVAAQAAMGAAFRVGQHEQDAPPELRTEGLLRWSRNPIYLGSFTFLLGMALWCPSIALLSLTVLLGLAMHQLVLSEEAFWAQRSPQAFAAWCARVPRYVGWV